MKSLKISHYSKIGKYKEGMSFSRFCEKFEEYVSLMAIENEKLYLLFLQCVDDITHSKLKSIELEDDEKASAELFCENYKALMYEGTTLSVKMEVLRCLQSDSEDIEHYEHKLRELAFRVCPDKESADELCLMGFLGGIRDENLRADIEKTFPTEFDEVVKMAKKLESFYLRRRSGKSKFQSDTL